MTKREVVYKDEALLAVLNVDWHEKGSQLTLSHIYEAVEALPAVEPDEEKTPAELMRLLSGLMANEETQVTRSSVTRQATPRHEWEHSSRRSDAIEALHNLNFYQAMTDYEKYIVDWTIISLGDLTSMPQPCVAIPLSSEQLDDAVAKVLEPLEWKDKTRPFYNDNFEKGVKALADILRAK